MPIEEVIQRASEIGRDFIAPRAEEIDIKAKWPGEGLRELQKNKFGGLIISPESGGMGAGLYGLVRVCEEIGKYCASTALCFGMHCVGSAVIAAKATDYQKNNFLVPISQGKHLSTLALSEPGTGAHFYIPQSKLTRIENGYQVSGAKTFVTNGGFADSYVVSTKAIDEMAPPDQFSCVIVKEGTSGLVWGKEWDGMGMRGNSSRPMELKDIEISRDHLLGKEGDQLWYIFNVVAPYFLSAMAGTYMGIAQAAVDEAIQHLKKRTYAHSGQKLNQVSVLQHKMGKLWTQVARSRKLLHHAAMEGDHGNADSILPILSAKADVADTVTFAINEAMTLTGGIAYWKNSKLERMMRDARAAHVMGPTTDMLYTWLGRALLEQPILVE